MRYQPLATKNKLARKNQLNLSARICGVDMQLASDPLSPLLHSRYSIVPLFSMGDDPLIDTYPVVANPENKIASIIQFNIEPRTSRVQAGIAHRLITD